MLAVRCMLIFVTSRRRRTVLLKLFRLKSCMFIPLGRCTSGAFFLGGVPGTGKTATVLGVLQELDEKRQSGLLPQFNKVPVGELSGQG